MCKFTRFQTMPFKKTAFFWRHYSVISYYHKCSILSWGTLKRKEQHKDDEKILLTWELSILFGYSLTSFSLKSITEWQAECITIQTQHIFIDKKQFICFLSTWELKLRNTNVSSFFKCHPYALHREIISTSGQTGVVFISAPAAEEILTWGSSPQNLTEK